MKKRTKIIIGVILSIVAVLLISLTTLVCMNWEIAKGVFSLLKSAPGNNFKAAWIFLTENSDGIETRLNENQEKYGEAVNNILSDLNEQGSGISKEAVEALNSGLYTEEEMIRIISSGGAELEAINREKQQTEGGAGENGNSGETGTDKVTDPDGEKEQGAETVNPPKNPDGDSENDSGKNTNTDTPVSGNSGDSGNNQTNPPSGNNNGNIDSGDKGGNNQPDKSGDKTNSQKPDGGAQGEASKPVTPQQPQPDDTAASVAKLYIIKSNFVSQLSSIEKEITSAYVSLPKEQQTPASRKSIAGEYISTVADLELECDAQVEAILSELKAKLEAASKDTSVVETIRQAYENEKSLKKAYYMDIYMNGLPDKPVSKK